MSKAYTPQNTSRLFYIPPTLQSDFDEFLDNDIPHTNMDFEVYHDWFAQFEEGFKAPIVRGELYPDSTKSRYENTDNNMNIRCSVDSGILKGDIVRSEDGDLYILDWATQKQSNNIPSRALRCNMQLTITREGTPPTDEDGYILDDDGFVVDTDDYEPSKHDEIIVDHLPSNAYRYDGRPEYSAVSGTPGVSPNALTLMTVQYNSATAKIKIDDRFAWGKEVYEIVDIDRVGLDINETYGTLKLQAKKMPGGIYND